MARGVPVRRVTLNNDVHDVAGRAGIAGHAHVTAHTRRHAFGDHIAKYAGLRVAQALMGHSSVETTASTYTSRVGIEELDAAVAEFRYTGDDPTTTKIAGPSSGSGTSGPRGGLGASASDVDDQAGSDHVEVEAVNTLEAVNTMLAGRLESPHAGSPVGRLSACARR
jgi:hypothetical protein